MEVKDHNAMIDRFQKHESELYKKINELETENELLAEKNEKLKAA